jgi:hypothetical protein
MPSIESINAQSMYSPLPLRPRRTNAAQLAPNAWTPVR